MTVESPEETEEIETVTWRRLSPRMLVVHPVHELIRAFPLLVVLLFSASVGGRPPWWTLVGIAATIVFGTIRWFTTKYQITDDQVQVRKGLFRRVVLTVPLDRVRTVDVTANFMRRLLGLAKVTIGTGQSDRKNEGLHLDGLSTAEAEHLHHELLHRQPAEAHADPDAPAPAETELARLEPRWIGYGPFTLSGVVTAAAIIGFGWRILHEANVAPDRVGVVRDTVGQLSHVSLLQAVAEVAAVALVIVTVFSTVGYVAAFWNYRLTRHPGGTLRVTRGLVTTRATTLEERRIRGVELSEPLLLRAARGARVIAVATGLRVGKGAERGGSLLLPPAPRAVAQRIAGEVLHAADPVTVPLLAHGPRARLRRFSRALVGSTLLVLALGAALWLLDASPWSALWALPLYPVAALLAADRYAALGHALSGAFLVTRQGSLVRRRVVLARDGIIGWNLDQSFFQRRAGLVTLTATTAAGRQGYPVADLDAAAALALAEQAVPGLLRPFLV